MIYDFFWNQSQKVEYELFEPRAQIIGGDLLK